MQRQHTFKIKSCALTDIGLSRPNNKDVWAHVPEAQFYVIADGMGGHSAGEIAAKQAVDHACSLVRDYFLKHKRPSLEELKKFLREMIVDANRWVFDIAAENPDWTGMGTTFSCLLFSEQVVLCGHVGDSRIYRYREAMEQLTTDHTVRVQTKNFITKAIGTAPFIEPDVNVFSALEDDV